MDTTILGVTLALAGTWLLVLTLIVVLLIRQVGLITIQLSHRQPANFDAVEDGPEIGSQMAEKVVDALPKLQELQPYFLLLLSSSCVPCRELASTISRLESRTELIVLLAGSDELAQGMTELLPKDLVVIRDPKATDLADAMRIHSTPFAVKILDGTVMGKQYVHQISDLRQLMISQDAPMNHSDVSTAALDSAQLTPT